MLIFIAMPTKGSVKDRAIRSSVLGLVAHLHVKHPEHTFIAPMIQDYQLLPHMPDTAATWEDWGKHCRCIIERSDEVWVLQLDGWDQSVGVAGEIAHAQLFEVPVRFLTVE